MSDEDNSPRSTSEATPPHVGYSPESPDMPAPPSPPEEERVTSSTDGQPSEIADSPVEQTISSSEQELNDNAGPSSSEPTTVRILLQTSEAKPADEISPNMQNQVLSDPVPQIENQPHSDEPTNPEARQLLEAPSELPLRDVPHLSTAGDEIYADMVGAIAESNPAALEAAQMKTTEDDKVGKSKDVIKRNTNEEKSDDSNDQFDVEDLSPASKSSLECVDLGSHSSLTASDIPVVEQIGSGSSVAEDAGVENYSTPEINVIKDEGSLGISTTENLGIKSELPSSKTDSATPDAGNDTTDNTGLKCELSSSKTGTAMLSPEAGAMENVGLKSETSPSKTGTAGVEEISPSSSTKKVRDNVSPKRKSPSKVQHLLPKRSAPFSPEKLQLQSESSMSTLLEELDIEETKDTQKQGSSEPSSGLEQGNMEVEEYQKEESEQDDMEVQETNSETAQGEVAEKFSKKDDSETEDTD